MNKETTELLIKKALEMRKFSYVPYSDFAVGAALLSSDGRIFTGCNIENSAYGSTICAERNAFFKAVSEGCRSFSAIAIAGGNRDSEPLDYAYPCGSCRQVMREFCNPESFSIIVAKSSKDYKTFTLNQLLPESFGPENLN